jgi:hypothetical protein
VKRSLIAVRGELQDRRCPSRCPGRRRRAVRCGARESGHRRHGGGLTAAGAKGA